MPSDTASPSGRPNCSARQPLLVEPVARLVQDAEEGRVEELLVVAGGDAAIVRAQRGAEGMRRRRPAGRG